jgi:hypothetical protein
MGNLQIVNPPAESLIVASRTTKQSLLSRAKAAIEAGQQSMEDAAEALGLAQEEHAATQREMAEAVGKSAAWVNALLKWRRSGYQDDSPFGPKTKAGRVQHAEQRPRLTPKRETGPRGAAGHARNARRAEGARQLYDPIEELKTILSAAVFDDRDREQFRRTHSPHLDGFVDEKGRCRFTSATIKPPLLIGRPNSASAEQSAENQGAHSEPDQAP